MQQARTQGHTHKLALPVHKHLYYGVTGKLMHHGY